MDLWSYQISDHQIRPTRHWLATTRRVDAQKRREMDFSEGREKNGVEAMDVIQRIKRKNDVKLGTKSKSRIFIIV